MMVILCLVDMIMLKFLSFASFEMIESMSSIVVLISLLSWTLCPYYVTPKPNDSFNLFTDALEWDLNHRPWNKRRNEQKFWFKTKDMDKTIFFYVKTIFLKFSKQNPKRWFINIFTYKRTSKMYFWIKNSKKSKTKKWDFTRESALERPALGAPTSNCRPSSHSRQNNQNFQ